MARKKHQEEHVNLERWLVSYADFITLLFATFVVLYALAQGDISEYTQLEASLKKAFAAPSILQGSDGFMSNQGQSILGSAGFQDQALIPPMLEYTSQKYEQDSFESIKKSLDSLNKKGEMKGVDTSILERGLVIHIKDMNLFFNSGSATLTNDANKTLETVGKIIRSKFANHFIRIEGHTDNLPLSSSLYPSNWELSSARASSIVRFLLEHFKFKKDKFAALGYADTRPLKENKTEKGRQKNRRVEIVVLRNKYTKSEAKFNKKVAAKDSAEALKQHQKKVKYKTSTISDAAQKLMGENGGQVIMLKDSYFEKTLQAKDALDEFEDKKNDRINLY